MRILVVGATGLIGKAVVQELSQRHEVVSIGHSHSDITVDITDYESIQAMYKNIGQFDAVVATTGKVVFSPFSQLTPKEYSLGLNSKLMGQVNLVSLGCRHIKDQGSFTLTSGILNHDPIKAGVSASMVNGALEGFVRAAAIEMPRGIRINLVSPTVISEAMEGYGAFFRGFKPVPVSEAALAYSKSVEGLQTGQIYKVGY